MQVGHACTLSVDFYDTLAVCSMGAHAQTKKAVREPSQNKEFWMNALGVLAVAVLSILFAKGKLRVRTA